MKIHQSINHKCSLQLQKQIGPHNCVPVVKFNFCLKSPTFHMVTNIHKEKPNIVLNCGIFKNTFITMPTMIKIC